MKNFLAFIFVLNFLTTAYATPGDVLCSGATLDNQEISVFIAYDQHGQPPAFLTLTIGKHSPVQFNTVYKFQDNLGSLENPHYVTTIEAFEEDNRIKLVQPNDLREENFYEGFLDFTIEATLDNQIVPIRGQEIIVQCPY